METDGDGYRAVNRLVQDDNSNGLAGAEDLNGLVYDDAGGGPVLANSSGDPNFRAVAESGMRAIRSAIWTISSSLSARQTAP